MDIEKLKKHVHPDANKNLNPAQTIFWYIFIFIPFLIFTMGSGVALLMYFVGNNDSYKISNLGFAILIGLASVSFSYYKLLENANYIKIHKDVQRCGEFFLISAIAFIVSSALKYSWFTLHNDSSWLYRTGLKTGFCCTFFVAEAICIIGLARLIDVLHIRMTNPNP